MAGGGPAAWAWIGQRMMPVVHTMNERTFPSYKTRTAEISRFMTYPTNHYAALTDTSRQADGFIPSFI